MARRASPNSTLAGRSSPAPANLNAQALAAVEEEPLDAKQRKRIQSVEHGVRVLEALIKPRRSLPLREIAATAAMSRSQTHRYLLSYVNTGLVRQDPLSGFYCLGPMALRIGIAALSHLDQVQETSACLRALVDDSGYSGCMTVWGDYGPTIIRLLDGEQPIVISHNIGSVLPLLTSSNGMVFLAYQPEAKSRPILDAEMAHSDLDEATIAQRIAGVRAVGYATTKGSVIPGLSSIAAPVFDLQGWPSATIGLFTRSTDKNFFTQRNIDAVCSAAKDASRSLGWDEATGPAVRAPAQKAPKPSGKRARAAE